MPELLSCMISENYLTVKSQGYFLFWWVATLFCTKWILLDHRCPKRADSGGNCQRQCCLAFSFRLQTHQVLSEAKKSDAEKREKLLDLYVRTEEFLDQLDTDFIDTLQVSLGDFKTTLKENIESFKPRDQYIVLVAGKFFYTFSRKERHQIDSYCFFLVFFSEKKIDREFHSLFFFTFYVFVMKTDEIQLLQ